MNKSAFLKGLIPHTVAIAAFIVLTVILFSPIFFENKSINQTDILQGAGANQDLIEHREKTGEEALWTNGMFGGMPAYLINVRWSGELTAYIYTIMTLGLPSPASQTFIAMLSFYILLLVFGVNPYLAIAGGIAYGLNSFFMVSIEAGHIWKISAIAFMPLVLAGIETCFRKKYLLGFALTALALSLEIRSNHFQITYYLMLIVLVYGAFKLIEAIKTKQLPSFAQTMGVLILAVLISVGANLGKLWSAYEYGEYSIRGASELSSNTQSSGGLDRDYAFRWSNGKMESFTFLVPHFYGGATQEKLSTKSVFAEGLKAQGAGQREIENYLKNPMPTYWGDQPFTSGPTYAGAIVIFLFVLGIFIIPGQHKWWMVIASALGLVLSWGKNFEVFNYFVFDYLPGYNKFRSVSMTVVMPLLCMPLLGILALMEVFEKGWKAYEKPILYSLAIVGGLCLLFMIAAGMMSFKAPVDAQIGDQAWLIELLRDQRASMLRTDSFRSLFLIVALLAVVFFWGKAKLSKTLATSLIVFLFAFDYLMVDKRYINEENFKKNLSSTYFAPSEADKAILKDSDIHYRVLNLSDPFNDAKTSYFHSSIGGYHGAKMRRYQDLIENRMQEDINVAIDQLRTGSTDFSKAGVLNMLNTKYLKFGEQSNQIIQNTHALGHAWFVSNLQKVGSADEEIALLGEVDTRTTAIINTNKFLVSGESLGEGNITLTDYSLNYLKYSSKNNQNGLAVFSEIYYPKGWIATIDGKEATILQANYVLRALEIPAGEHIVEFKFQPKVYTLGNKVMMGSSALLIGILIVALGLSIRKLLI